MKSRLIQANISILMEGKQVLEQLDLSTFTKVENNGLDSSIGAHFRHLLEHYQCFFLQYESGVICYDNRQRQQKLETDIHCALRAIEQLLVQLNNLTASKLIEKVKLDDQVAGGVVESNLARELLFLHSHSTHHYALIATILKQNNIKVAKEFGVAIATRFYEEKVKQAEGAQCVR